MPPDADNLTTVLGPLTGSGSRTVTVTASRSMSLMLGCAGRGVLVVRGPLTAGAVPCSGPGRRRAFDGYYWAHVRVRPGARLRLSVTADAQTTWDIRVCGLPRRAVASITTAGP
jgi:hypothetical protein